MFTPRDDEVVCMPTEHGFATVSPRVNTLCNASLTSSQAQESIRS